MDGAKFLSRDVDAESSFLDAPIHALMSYTYLWFYASK